MRKGEVWWADLPSPIGKRPVMLLSRDEAYAVRNAVTVAPVARTIRDIPVEVLLDILDITDGLPKKCVVNLDTVITIQKNLLKERICLLKEEKVRQINAAIKFALDL